MDKQRRICLGVIPNGTLLGITQVLFDNDPNYEIEANAYCSVGFVHRDKFIELFERFRSLRIEMIDFVYSNPFETERQYFIDLCRKRVPFFKKIKENTLKQIYHRSKQRFYDYGEKLFEVGQPCTEIYFILGGLIDIAVTDGYYKRNTMDVVGVGSVIGVHNIINNEIWYYEAYNATTRSCKILTVQYSLLKSIMQVDKELTKAMEDMSIHISTH